ncbi:MAG TPA: LysR family transcriptional regulator, partial [Desulfobaccales bacterium]|nr:LysR family transcriptional regulator [Desulfobaccales bacterium]
MEWQQLLGFYQVAKLESFTRAAEATFRTQSALSQQVKALEEELGTPLLERLGKRRLKLTPAGEKLFDFAQGVLGQWDRLQDELKALKGRPQGPLRLAAPFTTLYHLLPETLLAYLRQFPQVELTLLDRTQANVFALVKDGDVDFGLALESLVPGGLAALRWQPVDTVLLTPANHPLARRRRVTWQQIVRYPLILPPWGHESGHRRLLEEQFRKLGLSFRFILESSNVELSARYVETGLGLAFATLARGLTQRRDLAFVPLDHYFKPDYLAL